MNSKEYLEFKAKHNIKMPETYEEVMAMAAGGHGPIPEELASETVADDVRVEKTTLGGVKAIWFRLDGAPKDKVVMYLHGGGFTGGATNFHFMSALAKATGYNVVSVEYRLAPAHQYPCAPNDCIAAYEELLSMGYSNKNIVFCGESAGANLSICITLKLKDQKKPLPCAVAASSPSVLKRSTFKVAMYAPVQVAETCPNDPIEDPYISSIYGDFNGFPPLLIQEATGEASYQDNVNFARRMKSFDCEYHFCPWEGLEHTFFVYAGQFPEADAGLAEIAAFIKEKLC